MGKKKRRRQKDLWIATNEIPVPAGHPFYEALEAFLKVTLSIGVASAPADVQTGNALIQTADAALYYAKKSGRARLVDAGQVSPRRYFRRQLSSD